MALCAYHETTDAVATCNSCSQAICDSCLCYGQDGMCGMCVEMASSRRASGAASRAARVSEPVRAPQPAGRASGALPKGPDGSAPPRGPLPPAAKPAVRAGMCAAHPDQAAKASCTHCAKKVCPYCLDLYDLCTDCRQLPQCARHESMVGAKRCAGCKMSFCKVCLDNTEYCDRCRTLRQASGQSVNSRAPQAKSGTGSLAGKANTGSLAKAAPPPQGKGTTGSLANKGAPQPGLKPGTDPRLRAATDPKLRQQAASSSGLPWPALAVAGVVLLGVAYRVFFGGKSSLPPAEALAALKSEMAMVQHAATVIQGESGSFPSTSEAILAELKTEGIDPKDLPIPFKLSVGSPPTEPLSLSYVPAHGGFEIHGLDDTGHALTEGGKELVLHETATNSRAAGGQPKPTAPSP